MARCPPGVICISDGILILFTTLLLGIIGCLMFFISTKEPKEYITHKERTIQHALQPAPIIIQNRGDSRYEQAPLPLQPGFVSSLPINIPTQGLPPSFQSIGIINAGDQILPLYGRRTTGSSDRWNYYTRTDTYNPVPIPISFQRRDCMDDVGCQEIMSGENIKIDALQKEGKTNIYRTDGPKYIPGIL